MIASCNKTSEAQVNMKYSKSLMEQSMVELKANQNKRNKEAGFHHSKKLEMEVQDPHALIISLKTIKDNISSSSQCFFKSMEGSFSELIRSRLHNQ